MGESNPFATVLDGIVSSLVANQKKEGDFVGEDGLLYCGKCCTPKQCIVNWHDGSKKTVPTICQCAKDKEQRRKDQEEYERLKAKCNIEPKFIGVTFGSIEVNESNRRAVTISKRYVDKFTELYAENQGLLFYGGVGTGKSMLAHCVANELLNRLHYAASISLAKVLQSGFKNPEEEAEIMRKVKTAELLIVDDLGAERGTEYAQEFVFSVIDTRCNCSKPMIITTNLSIEEMQNCMDKKYKRIYDRLLECCYPVEFTGVSWRMRNAAKRYDKFTEMFGGSD